MRPIGRQGQIGCVSIDRMNNKLATPILHIQLLGDFRLTYLDKPLTAIDKARQQSLLAYLILHRDAPQARKHLAFLFWPDTSEEQALTNLRNLLHKLRQALPEPDRFLLSDMHTVQWHPQAACRLDVEVFTALAQSDLAVDLEQAANLYHGELLPSCYDDWIIPERERLQQMLMEALEKIIRQKETARAYAEALGYAKRLLGCDPLREETYRLLMRLYALNDDRAAAMHVYHTCATSLQRELGVAPGPATQQAYEKLIHLDKLPAAPARIQSAIFPLVGREAEWGLCQSLWQASPAARLRLVLIKGEAGIGKTRLAEELIGWANRQGVTTRIARGYAGQGQPAYAPLVEWLRSQSLGRLEQVWLTELARLLPEIAVQHPDLPAPAPLTQDWQRLRLFEAIATALIKDHPAQVLLLEDMQWCDRDTLAWLRYLLQSALYASSGAQMLVAGTRRTEEQPADPALELFLEDLRRTDQLSEIELGPLDEPATSRLAAAITGHELEPFQKRLLFQGSEGNPLFVVEMVRAGLAKLEPGKPEQTSPGMQPGRTLPLKVRQVIEARLGQLTAPAQELVGLAAAAGRAFNLNVLQHAGSADEETLVQGLDELWRRRIVREQGTDAYAFSHDKIREVAYARLSLARRRLLHHRIALALESVYARALDPVSGQIAVHYELAGNLEQAIPYYERAAEAAQRVYANEDAIRDTRRAIALLEGPASYSQAAAVRLNERLGDILHWTGQYEEARQAFQKAIQATPKAEAVQLARLHRKSGNCWRDEHLYKEALEEYKKIDEILGQPAEQGSIEQWQEWIQAALETNLVYYWLGDLQESDRLRPSLQPAVEQYGSPGQRAVYFQDIVWIEFRRNRSVATAEMVSLAKAALKAQQEAGNQTGIPSGLFSVGFILLWHGEPEAACEPLRTALSMAEQTGDVSLQSRCLTYLTIACRQGYQEAEARQYAARSLEVAGQAQMPEYVAMAKANQAWLAWRENDPLQTAELAHAALETWGQLPPGHASAPFQWLANWPLIAVARAGGDIARALERVKALLDPSQQRLPEALEEGLKKAIQAWEGDMLEQARNLLSQSLALAEQMHYL